VYEVRQIIVLNRHRVAAVFDRGGRDGCVKFTRWRGQGGGQVGAVGVFC
jgi:hypothetical protein